jgi:hypothetical protein
MWPQNWGFLSHEYTKLNFNRPQTGTDSLKLPPLKPAQESKSLPFPKTTAREIGWRSAYRSLHLDIYGPYSTPRGNLVKNLKWPPDAIA